MRDFRVVLQERKEKEPNGAEFVSALAAGNNAQLIVAASYCAQKMVNPSHLLALVAAAHQTRGQVICIIPSYQELQSTKCALGSSDYANKLVKFIVGDPSHLLLTDEYKEADFLLIDCNLPNYEEIIEARRGGEKMRVVVGYNAFSKGSSSWQWRGLGTHLLPIADGLLVTKIGGSSRVFDRSGRSGSMRRKNNWIVKIDQRTGEEHVFKVRSCQRKLQVVV